MRAFHSPPRAPGEISTFERRVAATLNVIGRVLIGLGVLVLLFVVYQLWGTNIQEARAQNAAREEFTETLEEVNDLGADVLESLRSTSSASTTRAPTTSEADEEPAPEPSTTATTAPRVTTELVNLLSPQEGEPVALIEIPRLGVEKVVIQGTTVEDLKRGPGHYDETPLPGQEGNAAIAGHRTTYGAPFHNIDELDPGDEISVTTVLGTATYTVNDEPFIVEPEDVHVLDDVGDNRLTLTSCHPKFSARQRLIVTATLDGDPFPDLPTPGSSVQVEREVTLPADPTTTAPPAADAAGTTADDGTSTTADAEPSTSASTGERGDDEVDGLAGEEVDGLGGEEAAGRQAQLNLDEGLGGDSAAWPDVIFWGAVAAVVGLAVWFAARYWSSRATSRQWLRKLIVYTAASPLVLVVLYLLFENVDRLLPAY